jgi:ATP-dependent exoDNAse (exonuclease V) beta subunit
VDEFQDTDPIQAEIIFRLTTADEPAAQWHERRLIPGRLFMVGDPKQAIYRFRGADIATYRLARAAIERQFPSNVLRVASNFRSCDDILRHINQCFQTPLQGQESGYVALEPTRKAAEHGLVVDVSGRRLREMLGMLGAAARRGLRRATMCNPHRSDRMTMLQMCRRARPRGNAVGNRSGDLGAAPA